MAVKEDFYYQSANGQNRIHGIMWVPDGEVKAILQISHGMVEHMERYDEFAGFLTDRGILVIGNDHLGHGRSAASEDDWGYFGRDGSRMVVEDLHAVTERFQKEYPDVKYFLLGHSMGSFMARRYIMNYGERINGVIIMGTGTQPKLRIIGGRLLGGVLKVFYGERHRSGLMDRLMFGNFDRDFRTLEASSWLSKDPEIVKKYSRDPACGFKFTLNGMDTLFTTLLYIQNEKNIAKIPVSLPVLITSGDKDPVGKCGTGVREVYEAYKSHGVEDITIKLYSGDRHEILNETDRDQVYEDIYRWITGHI